MSSRMVARPTPDAAPISFPVSAVDFADVAWFVAGAIGDGPGVRGLSVTRSREGLVFADLTVTTRDLVDNLAERLGLGYSSANDDRYYEAHTQVGSLALSVAWLAPREENSL